MTFASKSSVGPSYAANGQEDHKTYTNLNHDTIIMMNDCYSESIAQSQWDVDVNVFDVNFDSIAQCLNVLRNVQVYSVMSGVKSDTFEMNPNALQ